MPDSLTPITPAETIGAPRRSFLRRLRPGRQIEVLQRHASAGALTAAQAQRFGRWFGTRRLQVGAQASAASFAGMIGLLSGLILACTTAGSDGTLALAEMLGLAVASGAGGRLLFLNPWSNVIQDGPLPGSAEMQRKRYEVVFHVCGSDGAGVIGANWNRFAKEITPDGCRDLLAGTGFAEIMLKEYSDQSTGAVGVTRWRQTLRLTDPAAPIFPTQKNMEMANSVVAAWYDHAGGFWTAAEMLNNPQQAPLGLHIGLGRDDAGTLIGLVERRLTDDGVLVDWHDEITVSARRTFTSLPELRVPRVEDVTIPSSVAGPFGPDDWAAAHEHVGEIAAKLANERQHLPGKPESESRSALEAQLSEAARTLTEAGRDLGT
jgi:hypothetical protein